MTNLSYLIIGIIIGMFATRFLSKVLDHHGTIVIDNSVSDDPIIFLESQETLASLSSRKYVTYKVEIRNYTQK